MDKKKIISPCEVNVSSETGNLRAVLLHRPGVEIERMSPDNASQALYSDILNKTVVDDEYAAYCGVLEKWAQVYYVEDILTELLKNDLNRETIINEHLHYCNGLFVETLRSVMDEATPRQLAKILIEGFEDPEWDGMSDERFLLAPLYNLFFTRDASSTVYNRVLINSMRFDVRKRESLLYNTIFKRFFKVETLSARNWNPVACIEGGDVHIAAPDLLCIGQSIRTNNKGFEYLAQTFARERDHFNIILQELPKNPSSFIHLDMAFTFLGEHRCMIFEPMLKRQGLFSTKKTTLVTIDHGKFSYHQMDNILDALKAVKWDMEPIFVGGDDQWVQEREQWHSGANFFAIGDCKVLGYRRNNRTIDALDKAGFAVLKAEELASGAVNIHDYDKFVATMPGSELPRGGGGARCMAMPILRDLPGTTAETPAK